MYTPIHVYIYIYIYMYVSMGPMHIYVGCGCFCICMGWLLYPCTPPACKGAVGNSKSPL